MILTRTLLEGSEIMSRLPLVAAIILLTVLIAPEALCQQFTSYTVKQGDTLYRIARTHYVTVESLRKLNDIEKDHIEPGQTLWIDGRPESSISDGLSVQGDSLVATGVSTIDADQSEPDSLSSDAAEPDTVGSGEVSVAVDFTQEGDSTEAGLERSPNLDSVGIARPLLSEIADQSDAQGNTEPRQQSELIPHVVLDGETMFSIAARYGGNVDTLIAYNRDHDTFLAPGDTIFVPWAGSLGEHRVKAGETLFRLSKNYGTSVQHIRDLNGIVDDKIMTGMVLVVPLRPGVEVGATATTETNQVLDSGKVRVYPDIFEGRLMANGKSYIADRFTVSHTSIPLGTFVIVTDPETGSQTFAEVTDRLPPGSDVIMEVSRAVANVLNLEADDLEVEVRPAH